MRAYLKRVYASRLNSTTVIEAKQQWFRIDWIELWQFRDLITLFVKKEYISRYRQTALGPVWNILQPLIMSGILTVIFAKLGGLSTDGVPHVLFYLSGLVTWGYFSAAFIQTADILISSAYIFRKVYFPRLVMPLSVVISKSLIFFFQFAVFLSILLYYKIFTPQGESIHLSILEILIVTPISLGITALLSLGVGLCFAAITVKYRDLNHVLQFLLQLWFYGTPIVYPVSKIPEKYQWIILFNPLIAAIDFFRSAFLGTAALSPVYLVSALVFSLGTVFLGILLFTKIESEFVDVI